MKQYLLSVYQPDGDPPPPAVLDKVMRDVRQVEKAVKDAGAWVFSAGLHATSTATVVRVNDGQTVIADGPFAEGKEHIGGFTVIAVADLDAALQWARKFSAATTLPVEVWPVRDATKA